MCPTVLAMPAELDFRPADPRLVVDPYPVYRRMREAAPVYWDPDSDTWYLTRHADVVALLRDPRLSSRLPGRVGSQEGPYRMPFAMINDDPPEHTRLRRLANRAFTPRMVEQLRPRVEHIVGGLLDSVQHREGMDVVADLGYPLPITVIADMFGLPEELHDDFQRWSVAIIRAADLNRSGSDATPAEETALVQDLADYRAAVLTLIARRRRDPGDDLISALVHVRDDGDALSEPELLGICSLLIMAGHVTTTALIGAGVLALLQHPDQLDRLRHDQQLVGPAVEELLRYCSPATMATRAAGEDIEIGDKTIRAGQIVSLVLAAANRDPDVFVDPDLLDLGRDPNPHVGFAHGVHFCLGAPLTRLETQVALTTLLQRFPRLRLAGDPAPWPAMSVRGLAALPVAIA